jgi:glycosyltransferase 2 family protein
MNPKPPAVDNAPAQPAPRRRSPWQLISIVVSIGLMLFILSRIELDHFLEIVRGVPLVVLLGALAAYIMLNFFRTLRFRTFMPDPKPGIVELMPIVLYHNFLTRVLPFKTGEISYVVLLNRHLKQPVTEGISSLVSARLFELALVILGGSFGLLSVQTESLMHREVTFALMIGFLIVYLFALYHSGRLLRFLTRAWIRIIAPQLVKRVPKLEERIEQKLHVFAGQFDRIHNPRLLLTACLLSTCTYSMSVLFDIILMRGLGVETSVGLLLTVISLKMLIEAAPIAVSGFGVVEGGWTFGLVTLAGLDISTAASIAFFLHVAQIVSSAIVGTSGWFILTKLKVSRPAPQEASAVN